MRNFVTRILVLVLPLMIVACQQSPDPADSPSPESETETQDTLSERAIARTTIEGVDVQSSGQLCRTCMTNLRNALTRFQSVTIEHIQGRQFQIEYDRSRVSSADLTQAIEGAGSGEHGPFRVEDWRQANQR